MDMKTKYVLAALGITAAFGAGVHYSTQVKEQAAESYEAVHATWDKYKQDLSEKASSACDKTREIIDIIDPEFVPTLDKIVRTGFEEQRKK